VRWVHLLTPEGLLLTADNCLQAHLQLFELQSTYIAYYDSGPLLVVQPRNFVVSSAFVLDFVVSTQDGLHLST